MSGGGRACGCAVLALALVTAGHARAGDLVAAGAGTPGLRVSLKSSALLARAPDDTTLFPARESGEALWRLRFDLVSRAVPGVTCAAAYEHRATIASAGAGAAGAGVLPGAAPAPWRVRQLDWPVAERAGLAWHHEVDRASVAFRAWRADVTLGRQAIGWGRGVLFGAVDLFAPFTPLEADREWRRGVDAARGDIELADRVSLDLVAAAGERVETSAFGARLRGYVRDVDAELVLARRARDLVAGVTSSAEAGGAEVHGELAYFRTPEAVADAGRDVIKAVAGGSYRLAVGKGLPVVLEYHYSGFGLARARETRTRLADPAFAARYVRGDTQILGRHAIALLATYESSEELTFGATVLASPSDGSGVVTPNAVLSIGDRVTVTATAYLPYGATPAGGDLRSFFGETPVAAFVQISVYR